MPKASLNQQYFLHSRGIELPAEQKGWRKKRWEQREAELIINFIKEGNGAGNAQTPEERCALYLAARAKYEGKIILRQDTMRPPIHDGGIERYLVLLLIPMNPGQVELECAGMDYKGQPEKYREPKKEPSEVCPFEFLFVYEKDPVDYEGHIRQGNLGEPPLADEPALALVG